MGHIGLTPQSVNQLGGYRVQGRTLPQAQRLLEDADALEASGAFAVVLETVPGELAKIVTHRLRIVLHEILVAFVARIIPDSDLAESRSETVAFRYWLFRRTNYNHPRVCSRSLIVSKAHGA